MRNFERFNAVFSACLLCSILGLLFAVCSVVATVDKDFSHDSRQAKASASTSSGSKSKPSRINTLWDEKNQHLPYFDNSSVVNVTVPQDGTAYLTCRVRQLGDRTVSWIRRKDFHILTSGTSTYTTDQRFQAIHPDRSEDWTLQIKYVQKRDAGNYECQVTLEEGFISRFVSLNVVVPRATILGEADYYIKSGSTINLTCLITESPEPFVFWYHNDRMINFDNIRGGIQVKTAVGPVTYSGLLVSDAQHSDSGNYTCSSAYAKQTSITVHVLNGDKSAAIQRERHSSGSHRSATGASSVTVTCLAIGIAVFRFLVNATVR